MPRSTTLPASGWVPITRPRSTRFEYWRSTRVSKPASLSWASASSVGRPATVGTVASPGPVDTLIVTVEPSGASVFGRGSCAATVLRSTCGFSTLTMLTSKPRFWRICVAVADSRPITSGTVSCSGRSSR